jgi:hypothetical protein
VNLLFDGRIMTATTLCETCADDLWELVKRFATPERVRVPR